MTIFRGLALLIALVLLAPAHQAWAQAGTPPSPALSQSQSGAAEPVRLRRQCPRLCVEWFDGCNNCTCGKGWIDVCTPRICIRRKRARCLRYGF